MTRRCWIVALCGAFAAAGCDDTKSDPDPTTVVLNLPVYIHRTVAVRGVSEVNTEVYDFHVKNTRAAWSQCAINTQENIRQARRLVRPNGVLLGTNGSIESNADLDFLLANRANGAVGANIFYTDRVTGGFGQTPAEQGMFGGYSSYNVSTVVTRYGFLTYYGDLQATYNHQHTMAHEIGHQLSLPPQYSDPNGLMYEAGYRSGADLTGSVDEGSNFNAGTECRTARDWGRDRGMFTS